MPHDSVLDAIGNTPVVRLRRIAGGAGARVFAKLEFTNPGGSIKDRIGFWMIEAAERDGKLQPGGTIIEGTSGNTGVGLAMAAAIKGYQCVFVLPDKMSQEKIQNLRSFGARVVVTPSAVAPDDARSYYSVARRMAREIRGAFYIDQYNNPANRDCHYQTTGPEILAQMPDIDALVAGIGTGGTITGIGRYLKENKPGVEIVAVDPLGSIVHEVFTTGENKTPAQGYLIEGIGEDFIPGNYDFAQIDAMAQVGDKESFLKTRELLAVEGIYAGVSSGAALVGALRWIREQRGRLDGKNVLVIFPDSGNRYNSKVYDDDWMREAGFLETKTGSVGDLLRALQKRPGDLVTAKPHDKISAVIAKLSEAGVSQLPVRGECGGITGIVRESVILKSLYAGKSGVDEAVESLVDTAVEYVTAADSIERVSKLVTEGKVPLVSGADGELLGIITDIDLLNFLGSKH